MNKITLPPSHPFAGIAEKINRSYENIGNLQGEIARFFDDSEYNRLADDDLKIIPDLGDHFKSGQQLSVQNRPTEVAVQD